MTGSRARSTRSWSTSTPARRPARRARHRPWRSGCWTPGSRRPTCRSWAARRRSTTSSRGCAARGAKKPVLLLAHLDVVDARKEDWTVDPFTFLEKDGYFYGRGTTDDKAQAAIWVATLIRLKQEGFTPERDLIVALTADEEGWGPANGVDWLLKNHRRADRCRVRHQRRGAAGSSRMDAACSTRSRPLRSTSPRSASRRTTKADTARSR